MARKKYAILAAILFGAISIVSIAGCGCGENKSGGDETTEISNLENAEVEAAANEIVEAFKGGDADAIQAVVFGTDKSDTEQGIDDYFGTSDEEEGTGILEMIFSKDTITISDIDEASGKITYQVTAPDMSELFREILDDISNMEDDDFYQYVAEYIENAEMTTTTVTVDFTYIDDEFSADYTTQEFVNAISGGLLDAYQTLYQEMISEYLEDMEEGE